MSKSKSVASFATLYFPMVDNNIVNPVWSKDIFMEINLSEESVKEFLNAEVILFKIYGIKLMF